MIELCVVEAVEQVDGAGARGGHANPDLAGQLCVRGGPEGRELLVADLDELDPIPELGEGPHELEDAVAGVPLDPIDPHSWRRLSM